MASGPTRIGSPAARVVSITCVAYPCQVVSPAAATWYVPERCGLMSGRKKRVGRYVGKQVRAGRCAMLVVDDRQRIAFGREAEHGPRKVMAARRIHPAAAKNQVTTAAVADRVARLRAWSGRRRSKDRAGRLQPTGPIPNHRKCSRCRNGPAKHQLPRLRAPGHQVPSC